uniref:Uncharacterized protein n=1 Tax=viral metagenome TaxID=1070528 RepID=A0A6C0L1W6_9ZZZZ|tara:strand:- start:12385 stop:12984 length:600 start_codon:yes stop_codon:yes gene_type:complete
MAQLIINLSLRSEEDALLKNDMEYVEYFLKLMEGYLSFELVGSDGLMIQDNMGNKLSRDEFVFYLQVNLIQELQKGYSIQKDFIYIHEQFHMKILQQIIDEKGIHNLRSYGIPKNPGTYSKKDDQRMSWPEWRALALQKIVNYIILQRPSRIDFYDDGSRIISGGLLGEIRYKFHKIKDIYIFIERIKLYLKMIQKEVI